MWAAEGENPILIISSYNPDAHSTSVNISDFIEEYVRLGGKHPVLIENMNCKSFTESARWKERMKNILTKYTGSQQPKLVILLGQEAWASYLSQDNVNLKDIPVMCSMASRNAVILPNENVESLSVWMPESIDLFSDSLKHRLQGGFLYEYAVEDNIKLIKTLYPRTKHIAFLSDNSYGGVAMQAFVIKEMKKFPELDLILLDGRSHTIYSLVNALRNLPDNTAMLLGTWRVDKNDGYFMQNATYSMMEATPRNIPAFTLSSIGLGHWAIGGIMPDYRRLGKDMARQAIEIETHPADTLNLVQVIPNKTKMDNEKIVAADIDFSLLPSDTEFINKSATFYELYKYEIWTILCILILLVVALLGFILSYFRTKRLKDDLEQSESELRVAKDRAEESNRLKSAFLANMSHEIRTPLNSIVGFSNVLAEEEVSNEEKKSYYDIIQKNSDLLLRLINDILDISRLETDRVNFSYEKCDVVELCQQILTSLEYSNNKGNKLIFTSELTSYKLVTDIQRLQQVIINLLSNAMKFTENGTIKLELEINEANNQALFSVTDTGSGIPKDKQKQVFERFEKLNEYAQGTGLGLAICKLIVTKNGGDIWIDSDYAEGARFMFSHPLDISDQSF